MFFYSETSVYTGAPVDVTRMNGSAQYLKHLENLLMLCFFAQTGTFAEKVQAEREIKIAERKLAYWRKHNKFVLADVIAGLAKLRSQWREHPAVASRIPSLDVR